jgi:hypothetical protein
VTGWLARWLDRSRGNQLAALAALAMLLIVGVALAIVGSKADTRRESSGLSWPAARTSRPATAPASSPRPLNAGAATEPAPARAVAERFLAGYLAYSYGHAQLGAIRDVDPRLVRSLDQQRRPRVPPAARKRHPRVTSLQLLAQARGAMQATATVSDGSGSQYPLVVYLDQRPGGWVVTRLGDD